MNYRTARNNAIGRLVAVGVPEQGTVGPIRDFFENGPGEKKTPPALAADRCAVLGRLLELDSASLSARHYEREAADAWLKGDFGKCAEKMERAGSIWTQLGEKEHSSRAFMYAGRNYAHAGEHAKAAALLENSGEYYAAQETGASNAAIATYACAKSLEAAGETQNALKKYELAVARIGNAAGTLFEWKEKVEDCKRRIRECKCQITEQEASRHYERIANNPLANRAEQKVLEARRFLGANNGFAAFEVMAYAVLDFKAAGPDLAHREAELCVETAVLCEKMGNVKGAIKFYALAELAYGRAANNPVYEQDACRRNAETYKNKKELLESALTEHAGKAENADKLGKTAEAMRNHKAACERYKEAAEFWILAGLYGKAMRSLEARIRCLKKGGGEAGRQIINADMRIRNLRERTAQIERVNSYDPASDSAARIIPEHLSN